MGESTQLQCKPRAILHALDPQRQWMDAMHRSFDYGRRQAVPRALLMTEKEEACNEGNAEPTIHVLRLSVWLGGLDEKRDRLAASLRAVDSLVWTQL